LDICEAVPADFGKAIQLKPDYAKAYYGRGLAYKLEGNKDEATTDFETVLELTNGPYWQQQTEERLQELAAR
jgi:lipoprotein NlpI